MGVLLDEPWYKSPPAGTPASEKARRYLSHLWVIRGKSKALDLVGKAPLVETAEPTLYSTGYSRAGAGLRGNGVSNAAPKGLRTAVNIASGTNTSCAFVVFTLESDSISFTEFALLRATATSGSTGVAIGLFPSSRVVRSLLANVSWAAGNDRTDTRIAVGVPWVLGWYYSPAEGFWTYSSPVGRRFQRLGSVISGSGNVGAAGICYVGGALGGGGAGPGAFPGVIHLAGYSNKPVPKVWFETISRNPWAALLGPQEIVVPYEQDAPALPTLSALARTNTRRPRYTWTP